MDRRHVVVFLCALSLVSAGVCHADGVTVIIHGWHNSSGAPPWFPAAMRSAITAVRVGEENIGTITITGSTGNLSATYDPWNIDLNSSTSGEIVIDVDWSAVADHLISGVKADEVAVEIARSIAEGQLGENSLAELPIHLIGHSRGGGMVCEIARLLGVWGIEVDHLTPLDAHPLTEADPQPTFPVPPVIDAPVAVYENVLFTDTYWQGVSYPEGEYIAGAYNRQWPTMPGGYHDHPNPAYNGIADHLNVHLAYHGTIDLTTPATDSEGVIDTPERTSWFNDYETEGSVRGRKTGFFYSRIDGSGDRMSTDVPVVGGDGVVDGYHIGLGGNGGRTSLTWSSQVWPNLITLEVLDGGMNLRNGVHNLNAGVTLDLSYRGRDYDSSSDVALFFDADRNPYNGNTITTITTVNHAQVGTAIFLGSENWDTSGMSAGGFVGAAITDGVRTRYLYAAPELNFAVGGIFGDGFETGNTSAWSSSVE